MVGSFLYHMPRVHRRLNVRCYRWKFLLWNFGTKFRFSKMSFLKSGPRFFRVIKIDPTDLARVNFFWNFTPAIFESYNYDFLMFELIVLELRDTLNDCLTLNDNGVNGFQFQIESFLSGIDELSVFRNLQFVKNLILARCQPRTRHFIPVQHFRTERLSTKCYQIHLNFKRKPGVKDNQTHI